jgi:hypothetical protein
VAELRPAYLPPDPAGRTDYVAGEIAQCDFWFPDIHLPVGFGQTPDGEAAAGVDDGPGLLSGLLGGCWCRPGRRRICMPAGGSSSPPSGAVPRVLVWDGEGAVGRWRGKRINGGSATAGNLIDKRTMTEDVKARALGWAFGAVY